MRKWKSEPQVSAHRRIGRQDIGLAAIPFASLWKSPGQGNSLMSYQSSEDIRPREIKGLIPREHLLYLGAYRAAPGSNNTFEYIREQVRRGAYGPDVTVFTDPWLYDAPNDDVIVPPSFVEELKEAQHKLAILNLGLGFDLGQFGHANALLLDLRVEPPEVERFEPHGGQETIYSLPRRSGLPFSKVAADQAIQRALRKTLGIHRYQSPQDICPNLGPQRMQDATPYESGFCQTWVGLYLDTRLRNKHLDARQVTASMLSHSPKQLRDMVQSFSRKIDTVVSPHSFARGILAQIDSQVERFKNDFPKFAALIRKMARIWVDREQQEFLSVLLMISSDIRWDLAAIAAEMDNDKKKEVDEMLTTYLRENPADREPELALARISLSFRYPMVAKHFKEPVGRLTRSVEPLLAIYDALGFDEGIMSLMGEVYAVLEGNPDANFQETLDQRLNDLYYVKAIIDRADRKDWAPLIPALQEFSLKVQKGTVSEADVTQTWEWLYALTNRE